MLFRAPVCLLVFTLTCVVVEGQDDNFDPHTTVRCPTNELLSFIGHSYEAIHGRIWSIRCRQAPRVTRPCYWTNKINEINQPMSYACPGNQVLNGIRAYLSVDFTDMEYSVRCCTVSWKTTRNCYYTGFLNGWARGMSFNVPVGRVIKGVSSVSDSRTSDRRWKFYVCDLV